jgi:hypothetical protein
MRTAAPFWNVVVSANESNHVAVSEPAIWSRGWRSRSLTSPKISDSLAMISSKLLAAVTTKAASTSSTRAMESGEI